MGEELAFNANVPPSMPLPTALRLAALAALALTAIPCPAAPAVAAPATSINPNEYPRVGWRENETPEQKAERMRWFNEARFGMFIHWGVYSEWAGYVDGQRVGGAGEWLIEQGGGKVKMSKYLEARARFNPTKYDPDAWVRAAKAAGIDYIVITSRHHDGFCLWDSAITDHDVASTPGGKDLLKPLQEACLRHGVRFCLYYSIMDWYHADYGQRRAYNDVAKGETNMPRFVQEFLKPQLKEIAERFDPGILWFDGEWEKCYTTEMGEDIESWCRQIIPTAIVNNRVGKSRKGMQGMSAGYSGNKGVGDYGTPEQNIPANGFPKGVDWESCMTMNDTWGYVATDHNWKSATKLIRNLADCASKGGNYLLNVGPTGEGEIPAESLVRLAEIGAWMRVHGEAIKRTESSPFIKPFDWGRITRRGNDLYLIVFERPANGRLVLPLDNKPAAARFLGDATIQPVVQVDREGIVIALPTELPDRHASVIKLTLDGEPKPRASAAASGTTVKAKDGKVALLPAAATLSGGLEVEEKGGQPNIGMWTNPADTLGWSLSAPKGTYKVTVEVANTTAGNTLSLDFGDKRVLKVAVPKTGDWATYTTVEAGTVEIDGDTALKVSGGKIAGEGVANVRAIRLEKR